MKLEDTIEPYISYSTGFHSMRLFVFAFQDKGELEDELEFKITVFVLREFCFFCSF